MIQLSDFKPGQKVIIAGDRYYPEGKEAVVEKVGRKYVTLSGSWHTQYYVSSYDDRLIEKADYGSPTVLYPSKEAYQRALDRETLEKKLRKIFDWHSISKLSYEQLCRVNEIIEGKG